jgi:hypothetical protein
MDLANRRSPWTTDRKPIALADSSTEVFATGVTDQCSTTGSARFLSTTPASRLARLWSIADTRAGDVDIKWADQRRKDS